MFVMVLSTWCTPPVVHASTITVAWTAPGDDGNAGQAAAYDIRLSQATITDANWNSAQAITNEPAPALAGTQQTMAINVPTSGTWYVAMKTRDEANNWSGLSNVVQFTATDVDPGELLPDSYDLRQNYPNPFNPSTTIEFSLPAQALVSLTVYNLLGQTVCTLADRVFPAGDHLVVWNGRTESGWPVASGVYFYQLNAGGQHLTKSMTYVK